jgi:hypothetical protein
MFVCVNKIFLNVEWWMVRNITQKYIYVKELGWESTDWINVAQIMVTWLDLVSTIMYIRVRYNTMDFIPTRKVKFSQVDFSTWTWPNSQK